MRNDLSIYDTVEPWWDPADRRFAPLRALAPARMAYLNRNGLSVAGQAVLDVGCGGGFMTAPLAAAGGEVIGVDIAQGALDAAPPGGRACTQGALDGSPNASASLSVSKSPLVVSVTMPWLGRALASLSGFVATDAATEFILDASINAELFGNKLISNDEAGGVGWASLGAASAAEVSRPYFISPVASTASTSVTVVS